MNTNKSIPLLTTTILTALLLGACNAGQKDQAPNLL